MNNFWSVAVVLAFFIATQQAWAFDADIIIVPTDDATSLVFAPDGRSIYVGDPEGNIRTWDLATGEVSVRVKSALGADKSAFTNLVRVTSDGRRALTAYGTGEIRYVDLATREEVWQAKLFSEQLVSLALSPDGKFGIAGDLSTRLVLFRIEDGAIVWDYKHNGIVGDVAFSASGELIFEAETSRFRAETLEGYLADFNFQVPGSGAATFEDIDVAESGLVAAADFGEVHLYDGRTGKLVRVFKVEGELSANIVAISKDGKRLLTKLGNGQAGLFDATSGKQIGAVGGAGALKDLEGLAFSPDGRRFVVADNDGQISLWRTKGLKHIATAMIWSGGYVVFLPDGAFMIEIGEGEVFFRNDFDPSTAEPARVKAAFAK